MKTSEYRELFGKYEDGRNFNEVNKAVSGKEMSFEEVEELLEEALENGVSSSSIKKKINLSLQMLDELKKLPKEYHYFSGTKKASVGQTLKRRWVGVYKVGKKTWAFFTYTENSGGPSLLGYENFDVLFTHDKKKKLEDLKENFMEEEEIPEEN